mmetsp:Transcript_45742/g.98047  ORF Transcript_45742/g.98047 Transcript_45742/m.98047 type:complete len:247 (+) Transcript_45742:865-1605(+)
MVPSLGRFLANLLWRSTLVRDEEICLRDKEQLLQDPHLLAPLPEEAQGLLPEGGRLREVAAREVDLCQHGCGFCNAKLVLSFGEQSQRFFGHTHSSICVSPGCICMAAHQAGVGRTSLLLSLSKDVARLRCHLNSFPKLLESEVSIHQGMKDQGLLRLLVEELYKVQGFSAEVFGLQESFFSDLYLCHRVQQACQEEVLSGRRVRGGSEAIDGFHAHLERGLRVLLLQPRFHHIAQGLSLREVVSY